MGNPDEEAVLPAFCMLELTIHVEAIVYVFMYNRVRFYVNIIAEKLEGEGEVLHEFNEFKDDLDDPENLSNFEDWILDTLDDFMREAAPTLAPSDRKPITLLEYFSPPTFAFELVNKGGKLCAVQEDYDPKTHGDTSPRTEIVDFLPDDGNESVGSSSAGAIFPAEGVVLRSALPPVPLFSASELERVDDGLRDEELSDIPSKVRRVGTGEVFFFKAGFKDYGYLREMEIPTLTAQSQWQF
ncbi:hypothetical protein F4820DRAFT_441001 [Hypoxylon rubiginosum]|uniref:Uncharacterized protein n=1 Tax=Hypoxylon rubiginosum TaxID=110542 RepID=A0ACB9YJI6_9PEZI|nr:hypothetical protein F4820DRAFT_441001 [Hypoxylon rubiginosum]